MGQLSGLLLLLLLATGPSAPTSLSSPASLIPSFKRSYEAGEGAEVVTRMPGESFSIDLFCTQQYWLRKIIWCKGDLLKECDLGEFLLYPGWKFLTTEQNERIRLDDATNGCVAVFMLALQVEDSGTYWFGILDGLNIVPLRKIRVEVHEDPFVLNRTFPTPSAIVPSFERPKRTEVVIMVQGDSFRIECFYTQQYLHTKKTWCKGDLLKECDLGKVLFFSGWKFLTTEQNQRIRLDEQRNDCASLSLSAFQVEDSGLYWFGILTRQNVVPLRKIRVIVHEEQHDNDTVETASGNEESAYLVLILGSVTAGLITLAAAALVVMMLIKQKMRAADDFNLGEKPNCRIITLQVYKRNIVNNPLDKAMNTGSGILKKPKAKTEDATYVNIKLPLSSSNRKHPEEPIGALPSSGAVEYATIIFGSKE